MWLFTRRIINSRKTIIVVPLLIGFTIAFSCIFFRDRYIDRQLSETVTLNQEWLELTPEKPLKAGRDTQEITLYPDPSIKMVFCNGSKLAPVDGRSANIEAELIDSKGVTHRSSPGVSETMTGGLEVMTQSLNFEDLPKDTVFKTVRIKSSASYPVKKILWRCYNWSEVHK